MSAPALLAQLESLGVRVTADGERLRVSAAAGQLTDDLKASIAQAKPQLLALLAQRGCGRGGEFPVSFAQRRLWFLDQLEPGNSAYHLGASHRITTTIDVAAMVEAVNDVVRRQDALRTVIDQARGEPVQVVRPFESQPVPLLDLSQLPTAQRDAEQRRLTREEASRPFDLARGPLFRAALLRLAADDHVLLFTMHHVVSDGWSLGIFLSDLHVAYEARSAGRAPAFVPLQLSYGEHAARERATLSGQTLDDLLAYWRGRLGDASPTLALPTDRPRPNRRSFEGAALNFALSPEVSDGLRALARSERATLYMTLLAVFNVLLHRYSGQRDIVVGTPVANRHASEVERVIGMFVGTLPIRSDLEPGLAWRALLRQLREHVIDAQAHSALPFEKIVDELRPERNLAWSPVYQVVFALQNAPLASAFDVTTVAAMVDLSLFMWDEPQGIRATLEYNTALFDASTAEGLRDHFCALASSVLRAPDEAIGRLDMLGTAQRECILEGWNATVRTFSRDASLPALLHAAARRQPHAVALESAHPASEVLSVTRFTYQELFDASERLANQLCAHGVRAGDAVGLYVERSVGAVLALLAIVKAGAAYVPLDPADPVPRTLAVLRDAGIGTVISQRSLASRLPRADTRVLELEQLWALPAAAPAAAVVAPEADALAYIMFTSGTTGVPKGVCVTHRNVARLVCNTDYIELGPEETLLQFAPLAFDASTLEIWGALLNGAHLVVHSSHVPTASDLAQTLRQHRITTLWLTAGLFHQMVESELPALAAVRQVLAGGDVLSVPHVQKLLDAKTGGVVVNGYGPTENTTFTCCHRMLPGQQLSDTVPIGRPIANTRVYLLDELGQPVPPRVAGELFAAGDGVARGYLGAVEATASRFLADPFDARPGSRMYRTGDLARWRADGTIEFLGRRDRQVKVRGFRVELEEVEDALRHGPGVGDAAVVARRDASGSHALVGYVVAREGGSIDTGAVKRALAERCPPYMVPAALMQLDVLPLTPNGKLDRAALPEPNTLEPVRHEVVGPRTVVEAQLHAILERVLGRSGIGVTDNFFELGGHSLLAVRFFAQIERAFGIKLPVSTLFLAPDVAQLARRLQDEGFRSPWSSLVPIHGEGSRRPLFMVPGIGGNVLCYGDLGRLLGPDQPLYGLQARGLDDREAPFERIEPMAAHYVTEIRSMQPHGPYRLGGTCFGGVVAYEMARQLRAAGETVELLFVLEAWPPPQRPISSSARMRSHQIRFLVSAIKRNLAALRGMNLARRIGALIKGLKAVGEMASQGDVYRGDRAHMYVDRVSLANERALSLYRVQPYDGVLRCAIAARRSFTGDDTRQVWRQMAPRDYQQVELPATDSGMMLLLPCAESLAQWMRAAIDAVDGRPQPEGGARDVAKA
ncbi:MAG TPA: amino acid adenylation domain-containing protein [Burkholderiaceae bacterium]|nr:amino acid adenylation domain-containing protein [Burkholderiaceae bacterium]